MAHTCSLCGLVHNGHDSSRITTLEARTAELTRERDKAITMLAERDVRWQAENRIAEALRARAEKTEQERDALNQCVEKISKTYGAWCRCKQDDDVPAKWNALMEALTALSKEK